VADQAASAAGVGAPPVARRGAGDSEWRRLYDRRVLVDESDLTHYARIRNVALEGFATRGVEATSIRDVAAAAGVSAGMVQHLFKTKAGLRDAVNEYVVRVVADAFAGYGEGTPAEELMDEMGQRITGIVRDHHLALRYVARSVADGDPGGLALFDSFVAIADDIMGSLEQAGALRENLDRSWATLHAVVLNLSTVLMEDAVSRHLPTEFRDEAQLARWDQASRALFREGIFAGAARRGRTGAGTSS
jgi:AcrR family transcriptional regulator